MTDLAYGDDRLPERFWEKVYPEPNTGCWLWTAAKTAGYGVVRLGGKLQYAHHLTAELAYGPLPDGMERDHLCHTPACCNPADIEYVTHRVNMQRQHHGRYNAKKKQCKRGHTFDEANTLITYRGHRQCKACKPLYASKQKG